MGTNTRWNTLDDKIRRQNRRLISTRERRRRKEKGQKIKEINT
jgi:hypothetical protein